MKQRAVGQMVKAELAAQFHAKVDVRMDDRWDVKMRDLSIAGFDVMMGTGPEGQPKHGLHPMPHPRP